MMLDEIDEAWVAGKPKVIKYLNTIYSLVTAVSMKG